MKVLTLDAGNTRTKYHLFDSDVITASGILEKAEDLPELLKKTNPEKIGLCSVNPKATDKIKLSIPGKYARGVIEVSSSSRMNFHLEYDTPETLGNDRICSAAGALHLAPFDDLIFVIDSGTCITVNIIAEKIYKGGIIAPGIDTMLKSMHDYTGSLPLLEKYMPEYIQGRNTRDAMMSGVIILLKGIKQYLELNAKHYTHKAKIFITGGNGLFLKDVLQLDAIYEENLVALGIRMLVKLNS
ncbi:MAG: type III pantothenate kinase [Ignavibacteriaceae bacterium]|nr:type III pantothenate kinase [Ignavibacteriaceae bacterium]